MNELTTEVTEEIVIRELTINELESVNGGAVLHCIRHGNHWHCHVHESSLTLA